MPEDNSKINSKNIFQIKCTSGYGQMYRHNNGEFPYNNMQCADLL
jgi:hypothetical protein